MDIHESPGPESVEQLAKRVFTELHQTIISHESGSARGEVEPVHDMRVSVRRLRVALSNFTVCLTKEDRKRLQLRLENLADALGGVRDMDVIIAAMKAGLGTRSDQEKLVISRFIRRLRARRRSRLQTLKNYLRGEEYAGFKRDLPSEWIKTEPAEPYSAPVDIHPETREMIEEEHGQAA